MTLRRLASLVAFKEGKKSQARIGDIREILKIIAEIEAEHIYSGSDKMGPLECLVKRTEQTLSQLKRKKFKDAI